MRHVLALAFVASLLPLAAGAAEVRRPLAQSLTSLNFPVAESVRALPLPLEDAEFVGEVASHEIPVYLTSNEATRPAKLRLAYLNAISVMPETFRLTVKINDVVVGESSRQASGDPEALELKVPTGLLEAGFNSVRVSVRQSHRVDCSLSSSYELWTRLIPEQSHLSFIGGAPDIRELRDLPAVGTNRDGTTPIRVKVLRGSTPDDLARASRAVQSAVLLGQYVNPVVEFAPQTPGRTGLDIVVGTAVQLESAVGIRVAGAGPRSQVLQDQSDGRVALAITGATEAEVDAALDALAENAASATPLGSAAGLRALRNANGRRMKGGESITLAELGLETEPFRGRLSRQTVKLQLPPDFLAADYGRLTLATDAVYAPHLLATNKLIVRVNGAAIADVTMSKSGGDVLRKHLLQLPTSSFKPGLNTIDIESETRAASDDACDAVALLDQRERFLLAGTSELTIPALARIGALPNISSTMSGGLGLLSGELAVFIPKARAEAIDASLTVLAKMASVSGHATKVNVGFDRPPAGARHVLAVGSLGDMPDSALEAAELEPQKLRRAWSGELTSELPAGNASRIRLASIEPDQTLVVPASKPVAETDARSGGLTDELLGGGSTLEGMGKLFGGRDVAWLRENVGAVVNAASEPLRRTGILTSDEAAELIISDSSTLVMAQGARAQDLQTGPLSAVLPAIESTTVIVAPSPADLVGATASFLSGSLWQQLIGQAAVFNGTTREVSTKVSHALWLSQTAPLDLQNARLIAAGWLSRNVAFLLVSLLATLLILTMLVQQTLRKSGVREP
ncbi:MAG: cellulose biosynthesis cyclic di-GMP-binding regulatory protein BcsB [Microvirga sp.]